MNRAVGHFCAHTAGLDTNGCPLTILGGGKYKISDSGPLGNSFKFHFFKFFCDCHNKQRMSVTSRASDKLGWASTLKIFLPSWGWWDERDDTALQTQYSKFKPWRSETEHASSRSRRLPTILSFTSGWGGNIFVSFKPPRPGNEPRTPAWKATVLTTTLGPPRFMFITRKAMRTPLKIVHWFSVILAKKKQTWICI